MTCSPTRAAVLGEGVSVVKGQVGCAWRTRRGCEGSQGRGFLFSSRNLALSLDPHLTCLLFRVSSVPSWPEYWLPAGNYWNPSIIRMTTKKTIIFVSLVGKFGLRKVCATSKPPLGCLWKGPVHVSLWLISFIQVPLSWNLVTIQFQLIFIL